MLFQRSIPDDLLLERFKSYTIAITFNKANAKLIWVLHDLKKFVNYHCLYRSMKVLFLLIDIIMSLSGESILYRYVICLSRTIRQG